MTTELAAYLREDADFLERRGGVPKFTIERMRDAAQRLEAREVSEADVERAAKASWDQMESEMPHPIPWEEMHDDVRKRVRGRMRAALKAVREG